MKHRYIKCPCGKPIPIGTGRKCHSCLRAEAKEALKLGSIGQQIAAAKAKVLMDIAASPASAPVEVAQPVIVALAAEQLAKAWGAKTKRENKCR